MGDAAYECHTALACSDDIDSRFRHSECRLTGSGIVCRGPSDGSRQMSDIGGQVGKQGGGDGEAVLQGNGA